jgi:hypothetical protein
MTQVLLVHGLWRTPLSMYGLAKRLSREGFPSSLFAYQSVVQSYEAIVERLTSRLQQMAHAGPYAAVGYSLGGVLLRAAIPAVEGRAPEHLVFLGTPNRPPRLATQLGNFAPYRWFTGECGSRLASEDFYARLPAPTVPYSIIAGSWGPTGRWSPFGSDVNDGLVAVSETLVDAEDRPLVIPISHARLPHSTQVQDAVIGILRRSSRTAESPRMASGGG